MEEVTSTKESITGDISAPKIIAFVAVLILCKESFILFVSGVQLFDFLFAIIAIILAIIIFISLKFIDLSPVKIPYYWWLTLIFGIIFIGLAWITTSGIAGSYGGTRPYLGGVLLVIAGLTEILAEKKNIVHSKFIALVGAGFAIYESVMIIIQIIQVDLSQTSNIANPIIGIIAAAILIILITDKIDIKIPYEWWVVLTIGFVFFTWISIFYAGIGGIITLVAFVLLILGF
jgi:hypothetical protein